MLKAPPWTDTSRFNLEARLPDFRPDDRTAVAEMMKALLIERFGLKWHEERRTVPGYELVPDKKVLAQPASLLERFKGSGSAAGPNGVEGSNMPMSFLAEQLSKVPGRPVIDATSLSGVYTYKLNWRPLDEAEIARQRHFGVDVDNLPGSVFDSLLERLGLRLQPSKVLVNVIIIDNINRQPTVN